jgi:hypothetical protein
MEVVPPCPKIYIMDVLPKNYDNTMGKLDVPNLRVLSEGRKGVNDYIADSRSTSTSRWQLKVLSQKSQFCSLHVMST